MLDFPKDACLLTDYYQYTMAQAYFDKKRHLADAVFHLFFRRNPFGGNWSLAAGISDAIDFVMQFHFSNDALNYLASLGTKEQPVFSKDFLQYLATTKATVDISGIIDGQVVFPNEPLLCVRGPLFLCQLLETPLLNIINFQTLIATKASRIKLAARKKMVMDFGLRRAQGFDGGISATHAAFIGGIERTSNMLAAKLFGIMPGGTQAHSFIMSYESEQEAFDDFCSSFKDNAVLLVDTYDPIKGIDDAISSFKKLKAKGHRPAGIRLDSGDLSYLSFVLRATLDRAGFSDCKIFASGDLDEYAIEKLERDAAPIDAYGVGTRLVTAYDDPALTGVYKLASIREQHGEYRDTYKSYVSEKQSWPGQQAIMRYFLASIPAFDVIFDTRFGCSPIAKPYETKEELHIPLIKNGEKIFDQTLLQKRAFANTSLEKIPASLKMLKKCGEPYPVYFDANFPHKEAMSEKLRTK